MNEEQRAAAGARDAARMAEHAQAWSAGGNFQAVSAGEAARLAAVAERQAEHGGREAGE
jgi:hypothetical protein